MGTIWPAVTSCKAVIQLRRACSKAVGWSRTKTALKVSWDGMPWVRSRKRLSHSRFAWPKAAIWVKCLTPQITAHRPMTRTLVNGCKRVRARRGSSRSAKWSAKAASWVEDTGTPSVATTSWGRHQGNDTKDASTWNGQLAYFDAMRLGQEDGTVKIWEAETGKEFVTVPGAREPCTPCMPWLSVPTDGPWPGEAAMTR